MHGMPLELIAPACLPCSCCVREHAKAHLPASASTDDLEVQLLSPGAGDSPKTAPSLTPHDKQQLLQDALCPGLWQRWAR